MSRDAEGGGLAFGLKAALKPGLAIAGALIELLQMEIGRNRSRAAQGGETPNDAVALGLAALNPDGFDGFAPRPHGMRTELFARMRGAFAAQKKRRP